MYSDRNRQLSEASIHPERRTYGVYGLMEYTAVIPVGKGHFHVRFSGGCMTAYGVTPATYTTDNPAVMRLIEQSLPCRRGVIKKIKSHS